MPDLEENAKEFIRRMDLGEFDRGLSAKLKQLPIEELALVGKMLLKREIDRSAGLPDV